MDRYSQFLNKCMFITYDSTKIDIYKSLIKDNSAKNICRNLIHESTIDDILTNPETKGYVAKIKDEFIGFIFFKHEYDTYYLSLIATKPKLGFPLGQILLTKMEEGGKDNNVYTIQASAIPEAIDFYKKMNYEIKYYDEDSEEYLIQKSLISK